MRIIVLPGAVPAARAVAQFVVRTLRDRPDAVIGLPTGRTMIPVYETLVELHRRNRVTFRRATTFNLDEFVGLNPAHEGSYRSFMQRHLFGGLDIRPSRIHFPDANGDSPEDYDLRIEQAGGLDLCLLGIGVNGHVGFNEPSGTLAAKTHRVRLMPPTRRANAYLFTSLGDVPRHAVSMGIGTIMNARAVVLLATGADKSPIVQRALTGPVTTRVPGSLIQTHPNALVVLDQAAAAGLSRD